ncbi:MAG: dipicolinate synthase [Oscillospiraceae bacterium]|nr:dipicolinate synthase [Oscillospiraceae bacterium]
MITAKNIWVAGGDRRQGYLAGLLARDGHRVSLYALEQGADLAPDCTQCASPHGIDRAEVVIFPLPLCSGPDTLNAPLSHRTHPLRPLLEQLGPRQQIFAGMVGPAWAEAFEQQGLTVHDYFAREELTVANAVATAEGAVQLAMEELPVTVQDLEVLVLGYGRVGKLTAQRFAALGARVSVAARSVEQLAWAQAAGLHALPLHAVDTLLGGCELIVNTVPAQVLTAPHLAAVRHDALIMDLASKPGGVDMDCALRLGLRVLPAPGLPGRVAPASAAGYIRDTIYNILRQGGK